MPYIDKMVQEGNMLNDIADIFGSVGWKLERYFKKTVFTKSYIDPNVPTLAQNTMRIGVAEHMILKHPDPDTELYYGFALYGEVSSPFGFVPKRLWPKNQVERIKDDELGVTIVRPFDNYKELADWATNKSPMVKQTHTLYMYMMEQITDDLPHNGDIVTATDKDLKRSALDVEVHETELWGLSGSYAFKIKSAQPSYFQSPYAACSIRIPTREEKDASQSFDTPYIKGNWHYDSSIWVRGWIDNEHVSLTLLADAAAGYQDNGVPMIPLYLGKFDSESDTDKDNFALMGGSAFKTENPTYDFDDPKPLIADMVNMQPTLKDYVMTPSSGIDSVMVYRNIQGSKYQSHYLFIEAPSNQMPPELTYDKRDYPRAWKRTDSHVHAYKHNPSRYSGETAKEQSVQASYAKIAHMDDGVRGTLRNMIVTMPLSLNDEDVLKVVNEYCAVDGTKHLYDDYSFFLIEGVSPLTKIPGTPYRQLGIGIMQKPQYDDTVITDMLAANIEISTDDSQNSLVVNVYLNGRLVKKNVTVGNVGAEIAVEVRRGINEVELELISMTKGQQPTYRMQINVVEGGTGGLGVHSTFNLGDSTVGENGSILGEKPRDASRFEVIPNEGNE